MKLLALLLASTSLAAPPAIKSWPIPFGAKRKHEMAAYSERHYGQRTWRLRHPHVIVEHMSQTGTARAVYNTFAPDVPDVELHELPNVCSHFVIGSSGRIFRLVNLRTRCRHTVGLNWTAIGIEHVGYDDGDALANRRELRASLHLTQWLRCKFHIRLHDVIGHAESLASPFHHELVPSLRRQTHGDWKACLDAGLPAQAEALRVKVPSIERVPTACPASPSSPRTPSPRAPA
jgi:N-acetyl-anhydromuramyl-L-alanine amidase AmpD